MGFFIERHVTSNQHKRLKLKHPKVISQLISINILTMNNPMMIIVSYNISKVPDQQ